MTAIHYKSRVVSVAVKMKWLFYKHQRKNCQRSSRLLKQKKSKRWVKVYLNNRRIQGFFLHRFTKNQPKNRRLPKKPPRLASYISSLYLCQRLFSQQRTIMKSYPNLQVKQQFSTRPKKVHQLRHTTANLTTSCHLLSTRTHRIKR